MPIEIFIILILLFLVILAFVTEQFTSQIDYDDDDGKVFKEYDDEHKRNK